MDGLSLTGDRFFYGNPLASEGGYKRSEWFGTACCPANIACLVASLGNYIYAKSDDALWVNLFIGSNTTIATSQGKMNVAQKTNYPWDGNIAINISPEKKMKYKIYVRIPGWAVDHPVPGNTYKYLNDTKDDFTLTLNHQPVNYTMKNGYAVIEREWKKGDELNLILPMKVKRVIATDSIKQNENRVALQRGPLMYCLEHNDNNGKVMNLILPDDADFATQYNSNLLNGVVTINGDALALKPSADGASVETVHQKFTAIPYYAWANRGAGEMAVWVPRKVMGVEMKADTK